MLIYVRNMLHHRTVQTSRYVVNKQVWYRYLKENNTLVSIYFFRFDTSFLWGFPYLMSSIDYNEIFLCADHQAGVVLRKRGRGAAACREREPCACAWAGRRPRQRPRTPAVSRRRRTRTAPLHHPDPPHPPINVCSPIITLNILLKDKICSGTLTKPKIIFSN